MTFKTKDEITRSIIDKLYAAKVIKLDKQGHDKQYVKAYKIIMTELKKVEVKDD